MAAGRPGGRGRRPAEAGSWALATTARAAANCDATSLDTAPRNAHPRHVRAGYTTASACVRGRVITSAGRASPPTRARADARSF
jgi:hypothetical protein